MTDAITRVLTALYAIGPVLFGIGFLAPVIGELLVLAGYDAPFGQPAIVTGAAIGLAWGAYAQIRGSWI